MIPPIAFHPAYESSLPAGHRFPMRKYGLLAETLVTKGLAPLGFVTPDLAGAEILVHAHDPAYVAAVLAVAVPPEIERAIGLPVDAALVRRSRASVGGTLLA
ncbi:histone deacetylase, partial [Methylobacterium sp. WL18]